MTATKLEGYVVGRLLTLLASMPTEASVSDDDGGESPAWRSGGRSWSAKWMRGVGCPSRTWTRRSTRKVSLTGSSRWRPCWRNWAVYVR